MKEISKTHFHSIANETFNGSAYFTAEFDPSMTDHEKRQVVSRTATMLNMKKNCIILLIDRTWDVLPFIP